MLASISREIGMAEAEDVGVWAALEVTVAWAVEVGCAAYEVVDVAEDRDDSARGDRPP